MSLVQCLPHPVAPGRCRACPEVGCFFALPTSRAKCSAAGVPEAVAAEAVVAQIRREWQAARSAKEDGRG